MANNLLKGKTGVIFGALDEKSIAWKVAERCHGEGAKLVLTNAPVALRFGKINELGEKVSAPIIPADATSDEDLANLFRQSIEHFGGKIDFVLHSIGMSLNVRKKRAIHQCQIRLECTRLLTSAPCLFTGSCNRFIKMTK